MDFVFWKKFSLLSLLYTLQGVPITMIMYALPIVIKKKVNYGLVGTFIVASWPYSMKLLWSPIIDTIFIKSIGRRKTWIISSQILNGAILVGISFVVDDLMAMSRVDILTGIFFVVSFLASTQDVALDGWAIDMYAEGERHWQSITQAFGLGLGYFLSCSVFLALNSEEFCNMYLRSSPSPFPILTTGTFLMFWGVLYIFLSLLLFFYKESPVDENTEVLLKLIPVYRQIFKILQNRTILILIAFLLFIELGGGGLNVFTQKLVSNGFPQYYFSLSTIFNLPIYFATVYVVGRYVGRTPLTKWFVAYILGLVVTLVGLLLMYLYPVELNIGFSILVFLQLGVMTVIGVSRVVVKGAFFARISDPIISGTYLTLLNTFSNFGGLYPTTLVLHAIDWTTESECFYRNSTIVGFTWNSTIPSNVTLLDMNCGYECKLHEGICHYEVDGFYVASLGCVVFGLILAIPIVKWFLPLQWLDFKDSWTKLGGYNIKVPMASDEEDIIEMDSDGEEVPRSVDMLINEEEEMKP